MRRGQHAFTLVELLVVAAITAVLATVLLAAAGNHLASGRQVRCGQNLRNLAVANQQHAAAHGRYAPAAVDLMTANRRRWHGERAAGGMPFDGAKGPLAPYLGGDARVRACPEFTRGRGFKPGFEASNGGYGYNAVGVGSTSYLGGFNAAAFTLGLAPDAIDTPAQTLMFADTAFPQPYGKPTHLIEYSFAEPVRHLAWNSTREAGPADPSLHFRHLGRVNVVWADGHLSQESLNPRASPATASFRVGWFGDPADNAPFRPW